MPGNAEPGKEGVRSISGLESSSPGSHAGFKKMQDILKTGYKI